MTLERIEIPLPPSYQQMADAILAFHAEFYAVTNVDYSGTPADLVLLGLAERLLAASQNAVSVRAGGPTDGAGV